MKVAPALSCAFIAAGVSALKFSAKGRRANVDISVGGITQKHPTTFFAGSANEQGVADVDNDEDIAYYTTIKLGGKEYRVVLDTGSSDLWVYSPKEPINLTNTSALNATVPYAKGTVEGNIDFADFEFGGYEVSSQAFINAVNVTDMDDINGFLGLSFDSSSAVDDTIKKAYGNSSIAGRTPISNIFHQNPNLPNFISVLLGRTGDLDDEVEGTFTIAEYVEEFKAIMKEPKLPRQVVNMTNGLGESRWNVEVEGVFVNNHSVALESAIPGTKPNSLIAPLDTGFSYPPVAISTADAIYSSIPGAVKAVDGDSQTWIVPCMSTTSLVFKIGGKDFPVHPLDLTYTVTINNTHGDERTCCAATFVGKDMSKGLTDYDMILGAAFLKNVYAVFDWGNESDGGNEGPFMQLLSTTTFEEAEPEFLRVRAELLKTKPPEISPVEARKLLTGGAESSD